METQFAATDQDVDGLLRALAHATNTLLQEAAAAERHMDETNEECERLFELRIAAGRGGGAQPLLHDSAELLAHHRDSAAKTTWEHHSEQAHQYAAWWADVACITVQAAANGTAPPLVRLVAADPTQALSDEAASQLPDLPDHDRNLLHLAYSMSMGDGAGTSADLAPRVANLSGRLGARVRPGNGQEPVVQNDPFPEGRRRRIWGDLWTVHGVPSLPPLEELTNALAASPVPAQTVQEVREAGEQVEIAIGRVVRLAAVMGELAMHVRAGTVDPGLDEEMEIGQNAQQEMTSLLAAYARALTSALQVVRQTRD